MVGSLRADSGFFDEAILSFLEGRGIDYIISAKLTQRLQAAIVRDARWWALETGLELAEIAHQAQDWTRPRRIVVVRQSIERKTAHGKTLSLFADDPVEDDSVMNAPLSSDSGRGTGYSRCSNKENPGQFRDTENRKMAITHRVTIPDA